MKLNVKYASTKKVLQVNLIIIINLKITQKRLLLQKNYLIIEKFGQKTTKKKIKPRQKNFKEEQSKLKKKRINQHCEKCGNEEMYFWTL